jgi:hypothetical protein
MNNLQREVSVVTPADSNFIRVTIIVYYSFYLCFFLLSFFPFIYSSFFLSLFFTAVQLLTHFTCQIAIRQSAVTYSDYKWDQWHGGNSDDDSHVTAAPTTNTLRSPREDNTVLVSAMPERPPSYNPLHVHRPSQPAVPN